MAFTVISPVGGEVNLPDGCYFCYSVRHDVAVILKTMIIAALFLLPPSANLVAAVPASEAATASINRIERIVTTRRTVANSSLDLPLNVALVDSSTLARISASHIEQALQQIAGVNLQRGNGQEYLPALRSQVFTGAGGCGAILTAEDNIPLRAVGGCNINELFEAHSEMAQQIEVLKGPGSVLYGSNAMHGVINVITPDTTRGGGMAGLDMGSFGYRRFKLRAGENFGHSGIGINASLTDDSGYLANEGLSQQKINLRHRFDSTNVSYNSGVSYSHLQQDTAGYSKSYRDIMPQDDIDAAVPYRHAQALRLWSKLQFNFGTDTQLSVTPYLRDQSMQFIKHFLPGSPLEHNSQQSIGVQSLWQHDINDRLSWQLGLDSEFSHQQMREVQAEEASGSAFVIATVPKGKHYDYQVDSRVIAPFTALNWRLGNWFIQGGMRFEQVRYDYQNLMAAGRNKDDGTPCSMGGCRFNRPVTGINQFDDISPKLLASYQLNARMQLYANAAKGYRAPQTAELYQLQREQTTAELASETANSIELGLRYNTDALALRLAAYQMNKQHVIYRDSAFFNVNNGKTEHQGLEAELDYSISAQLQLALAGSYSRHRYRHHDTGSGYEIYLNDIDTAPRKVADARLNWQPTMAWQLALHWHYVGPYYTDADNLHQYNGHSLLNLYASWQYDDALSFSAKLTNVLDTAYAERADYSSFDGDRYYPGRPRQLALSLRYQWR